MKNGVKAFLFSSLFLTSVISSAQAQESVSWVQKIKNFFASSPVTEQTQTIVSAKKENTEQTPEKTAPIFDFSEKTIGDRNAPLKINIITSLTCPHCTGVHTQLLPYLQEKYVKTNEALLVLIDFPLDQRALTASLVSRCLKGDNYFAFMETLFEKQHAWAAAPNIQEALFPYAKLAGLTEEETISCATDEAAIKEIIRQRNLTIMRYKVHATPTIVLQLGKEKERLEGAPTKTEIDDIIKKLKKSYTGTWPAAASDKPETAPSAP